MPAELFNVSSGSITWDKEESEVARDDVAFITVSATGWTSGDQDLATAAALVPAYLPVTEDGPCGAAYLIADAELQRGRVRYADGMIRIEATYKKVLAEVIEGGGDGLNDRSPSDKVHKRISVTSEPLLSHPLVVNQFPYSQVGILAGLISGAIRPWSAIIIDSGTGNPDEYPAGKEFVRQNPTTNEWDIGVAFSTTVYSMEMGDDTVSASPLSYARLIKAGVTTYERSSTVLIWEAVRTESVSANEIDRVGSVVTLPPEIAPQVNDRDWIYVGMNENQSTENSFSIVREFSLSGPGGVSSEIYPGGTNSIMDEA